MVIESFEQLRDKVQAAGRCKVVVIAAHDAHTLEAVLKTREEGILDYILVGKEKEILEIGKSLGHEIDPADVIDSQTDEDAVEKGIQLVREGKADFIQKGLLQTSTLLKGVVDKEKGIRTGKAMSHVALLDVPTYHKILGVTDGGMMMYPDLAKKKDIAINAVEMFRGFGYERPKMAALCAVEVLNPKMQATVDAAELTKMCEEGQIPGCIVDGPLSLDLAIDPEAAKHKGATDRKIQGDADVLLFPDIHAGNLVYKAIVHMVKVKNGCILTGTKVPVVLTSRSDTFETKVYSLALAAVVAEEMKKNQK